MTNVERVRRHFSLDSSCPSCGYSIEDVDHVLRHCPLAYSIWENHIKPTVFNDFMNFPIKAWIVRNLTHANLFTDSPEDWDILFGALLWNIWLTRNAIEFESTVELTGLVVERSDDRREAGRRTILWHLRDLCHRNWVLRPTLIPREINMVADGIAKLALRDTIEETYYSVPPPSIQPLLIVDTGG
ncbi:hypothetical protein GQ457_02G038790 [Hibiscus cannabinus]